MKEITVCLLKLALSVSAFFAESCIHLQLQCDVPLPHPCIICTGTTDLGRFNDSTRGQIRSLVVTKAHLPIPNNSLFEGLDNLKVLDLRRNNITSIDEDSFSNMKNLVILYLSFNRITTVSKGVFKELVHLKELDLQHNRIENFEAGSFATLRNLTELTLNDNLITIVKRNTFKGLSRLNKLDLRQNNISHIDEGSFTKVPQLQELVITNNSISKIRKRTFSGLKNLKELHLSDNQISSIEKGSFAKLLLLQDLYMDSNQLKRVDFSDFSDLNNLRTIDFHGNKISHIDYNEPIKNCNLRLLNLRNNKLKQIPRLFWASRLTNTKVFLHGNRFPCTCGLINDIKQFQYKSKKLLIDSNCNNITHTCEEEHNFALGMDTTSNDFWAITLINDGNINTACSLITPEKNNRKSDLRSWVRMDLPGLVFVTNIILYGTRLNALITMSVGDKVQEEYETCGKCRNVSSSSYTYQAERNDILICNVSCDAIPKGSGIKLEYEWKSSKDVFWKTLDSRIAQPPSINEIVVHGYEEKLFNIWSEWGAWSDCSTTCGNGVKVRSKNCTKSTTVYCLLPSSKNRDFRHTEKGLCNLKLCPEVVYIWTIGGLLAFFILTGGIIVLWYKKYGMIRYASELRPDSSFALDPNKTLLDQVKDLPYDIHWEFPRKNVKFGRILGEGNFGKVWHCKAKGIKAFNPRDKGDLSTRAKLALLQDTKMPEYFTTVTEGYFLGDCDSTRYVDVAVKTLKDCATPEHQSDLASELKLLIYMGRHPNIINALAACTIRGNLWIILEYCDFGSLLAFLKERRVSFSPAWSKTGISVSEELCWYDLLAMAIQLTKGIMFLHFWKVVHRDIAARNILVSCDFTLKIADFGLARTDQFEGATDEILPIKWTALESLLHSVYTMKGDVWSFGVLLWEMFSLATVPYPGMASHEVINFLKDGHRMQAPSNCPTEVYEIMLLCWSENMESRPTIKEVFERLTDVRDAVTTGPSCKYYESVDDIDDIDIGPIFEQPVEVQGCVKRDLQEKIYPFAADEDVESILSHIVVHKDSNRNQVNIDQVSNTGSEVIYDKVANDVQAVNEHQLLNDDQGANAPQVLNETLVNDDQRLNDTKDASDLQVLNDAQLLSDDQCVNDDKVVCEAQRVNNGHDTA